MESIFISSTFKDMHMERDVLNLSILPYLNSELNKQGMSIQFSDLRWGIDTTGLSEQEAMRKILEVCEDEIDRCRPFIIVLLGDRYGTSISNALVDESDKSTYIGKSVTHVEILKGVFKNIERDRIYIYFRDIDYSNFPKELIDEYKDSNEEDVQKLCELKNQLKKEYSDRIRVYHANWDEEKNTLSSKDFEHIVLADLSEAIIEDTTLQQLSSVEKQEILIEKFLNIYTNNKYLNIDKIENVVEKIEKEDDISVILGESGSGKTVFISQLYNIAAMKNKAILYYFGINEYSVSVRNFVEFVLYNLNKIYKLNNKTNYESLTYIELIEEMAAKKIYINDYIFIFIDAIPLCDKKTQLDNFIRWANFYFDGKLKFICSTDDDSIIGLGERRKNNLIELRYSKDDMIGIVESIIKSNKKRLAPEISNVIIEKYSNPLQAKLLITRMSSLKHEDYMKIQSLGGGISAINEYLTQIINEAPADVTLLLKQIIDVLFDEYEKEQIYYILEYLTISEQGIREVDFRNLFKKNAFSWSDLVYANLHQKINYAFIKNMDGVINFSHYALKEGFVVNDVNARIKDLRDLYFESEKDDFWSTQEYFKYVIFCKDENNFIRFIMNRCVGTDDISSKNREIAKKAIAKICEEGNGEFLYNAIFECDSLNEKIQYIELLRSALILSRNLKNRKCVIDNVSLIMSLHNEVEEYPKSLMYVDYIECLKYVRRNNCTDLGMQLKNFYEEKLKIVQESVEESEATQETLFSLVMRLSVIQAFAQERQFEIVESEVRNLLDELNRFDQNDVMVNMFKGDCYKELGNAFKCMKNWSQAIEYDQKYLYLYEELMKYDQSEIVKEKYRVGLYNIANTYETCAIETSDMKMWQEASKKFKVSYDHEVIAIADELPDNRVVDAFSTMFSYCMSLLKVGKNEECHQIYIKSIKYIEKFSLARNSESLVATIVMFELDYIIEKLKEGFRNLNEEVDILAEFVGYINIGITENRQKYVLQAYSSFDQKSSELFAKYLKENNLGYAENLCGYYVKIARLFEKLNNNARLFVQNVRMFKNWGDINYIGLKNYQVSEMAYKEMIDFIRENNLLILFLQVNISEQLVDYICMAFSRIINAMFQQNKNIEAITFTESSCDNIQSLSKFTPRFIDVPAYILYSVAKQVDDLECRRILANYAIEIAKKMEKEIETNKKIILLCEELI